MLFFFFSFLEEDSDTMSVSVLLDGEESSLEFLDVHAQVTGGFNFFQFAYIIVHNNMINDCNIFFVNSFSQWLYFFIFSSDIF